MVNFGNNGQYTLNIIIFYISSKCSNEDESMDFIFAELILILFYLCTYDANQYAIT